MIFGTKPEPNAVVATVFYQDKSGQDFIGYIIRPNIKELTQVGLNLKDKMAKRGYNVTHHIVDEVYVKEIKHTHFDQWVQSMIENQA